MNVHFRSRTIACTPFLKSLGVMLGGTVFCQMMDRMDQTSSSEVEKPRSI